MPRSAFLATFMLLGIVTPPGASAQELDRPLSTEVSLADFGIARADFVLRGRVAVDWLPEGPRLSVRWLRDVPAPDHPPVLPGDLGDTTAGPGSPRDAAAESAGGRSEAPSAIWVWNTVEILRDADTRASFLSFVARQGIRRIFLYLPPAEGRSAENGFVPFDGKALEPLVRALTERGARVDALDGDPDYIRRSNHAGVVRTVQRVAAYNAKVPSSARFDGVHYDVEPYLERGYQGPAREEIFESYLDLVEAIAAAAHRGHLRVGLDVPFWLDAPDEETGELLEAIHDGTRTTVLQHVLSMVDEVAVMDYRTATSGPDGSIALVRGELRAAGSAGVRVWIGLETSPIADEDLYTFRPEASVDSVSSRGGPWIALEPKPGGRVGVWLVPAGGLGALRAEVASEGGDAAKLRFWRAGSGVRVPGDKLSFNRLGRTKLEHAARTITARLGGLPAFAGVAYHHYGSLSALLEGG